MIVKKLGDMNTNFEHFRTAHKMSHSLIMSMIFYLTTFLFIAGVCHLFVLGNILLTLIGAMSLYLASHSFRNCSCNRPHEHSSKSLQIKDLIEPVAIFSMLGIALLALFTLRIEALFLLIVCSFLLGSFFFGSSVWHYKRFFGH